METCLVTVPRSVLTATGCSQSAVMYAIAAIHRYLQHSSYIEPRTEAWGLLVVLLLYVICSCSLKWLLQINQKMLLVKAYRPYTPYPVLACNISISIRELS